MDSLFQPLILPCGVSLKNRIAKAAMSDSLGDGAGKPTQLQQHLYKTWAEGGLGLSIIGEVQCSPYYPEKPGNLVLDDDADIAQFRALAECGAHNGAQLWPQLGHAGAMSFQPISSAKGPSAIQVDGFSCGELSTGEIKELLALYARSASLAKESGFGGIEIHAAHGFLFSQFLSPLFNQRSDAYGGSIQNRASILLETIAAVRDEVGAEFPIGIKINSTDSLQGGLQEQEALDVVSALDKAGVDLIDISGGTYFPGAKSASDSGGDGPYFIEFAKQARQRTDIPLMLTGGIKTMHQAVHAIESGAVDVVGLARAMVLYPDLPNRWRQGKDVEPLFPRFTSAPEGGITAWYTMRLTEIAEGKSSFETPDDLDTALQIYLDRDSEREKTWLARFGSQG